MKKETRVGIYLTVILHLLVLIGFLLYQINSLVQKESTFVLDFTKQEEREEKAEKEKRREELSAELENLIAGIQQQSRNVAVDISERERHLKDDRNRNPEQVYDEAKSLQERLDAARKAVREQQGEEEMVPADRIDQKKTQTEAYTGPSVLEYRLDGRKAMNLPIPAYKCLGGGDVTVAIEVDRKGMVVEALIVADFSSMDHCLQEFAIRAARQSRFTSSTNAPPRQSGEIVYRFIPQ
ncbi:MAG TPA: hypothetical protein PKM89_01500 [Bacteroidales bacterium]|jgi:hypothetical protein|nr:hypothetical protein [Bacteroidales bacterium]HPS23995.1 hypothetical protein [Bacteroidales bacterium]